MFVHIFWLCTLGEGWFSRGCDQHGRVFRAIFGYCKGLSPLVYKDLLGGLIVGKRVFGGVYAVLIRALH